MERSMTNGGSGSRNRLTIVNLKEANLFFYLTVGNYWNKINAARWKYLATNIQKTVY